MKRFVILLIACILLASCSAKNETVEPEGANTTAAKAPSAEITDAPITTSPEITEPPITTSPEVTEPPITTSPEITEPPITTSPEITELPITTSPEVTEPPITTSPEITEPPITTSPEITEPPITTSPETTSPETDVPAVAPPPSCVLQFDPSMEGIYNYCPTVITESDGTRYIYYCTNKDGYQIIDYIGCRKGTPNADGSYTWSEETIVLSPSPEGAWDAHHTCDPSVIKGKFKYGNEEYAYLMAYLGCTSYDNQENKIGLAVANSPMGPFVKVGNEPLVDFTLDPAVTFFQWGVGQPSLVSIDKEGKAWLFYTRGDKNGTRVVVRECDFSSLDSPVMGTEKAVSVSGLKNLNGGGDFMNNADLAYDPVNDRFYAASDCHPNPSDEPNYIAGSFRINYMNGTDLTGGYWRTTATIGKSETTFPRNHNVGLARDEYGHLPNSGYVTVYYTVSETGSTSLWSYRIYEYNEKLG